MLPWKTQNDINKVIRWVNPWPPCRTEIWHWGTSAIISWSPLNIWWGSSLSWLPRSFTLMPGVFTRSSKRPVSALLHPGIWLCLQQRKCTWLVVLEHWAFRITPEKGQWTLNWTAWSGNESFCLFIVWSSQLCVLTHFRNSLSMLNSVL